MFNLIDEKWLPIVRQSGARGRIAPWEMTVEHERDPVVAIDPPRPDFRGALYQFQIGLLQSAFAPASEEAWWDAYETPPKPTKLREAFGTVASWFDLEDEKFPFMQERALSKEPKAEAEPILGLLIESPGENATKENTDLFTKRVQESTLCPSCAATALFTLQTNSPAGGRGTMTSLRGGGPLTTLVKDTTLWRTAWHAVIPAKSWARGAIPTKTSGRFPWVQERAPKDRKVTLTQMHPDQHYWAMPRRVLLTDGGAGDPCGLCSEEPGIYASFRSLHGGFQYVPPFEHPLSPTNKLDDLVLARKGRSDIGVYRHWLGLVESGSEGKSSPAKVVALFRDQRQGHLPPETRELRLWAFGYAMDNAKVEGWYEGTMPLFSVPLAHRANFVGHAEKLVAAADLAHRALRHGVKEALFDRPRDVAGDEQSLVLGFWERTESDFHENLDNARNSLEAGRPLDPLRQEWRKRLVDAASDIFARATRGATVGLGRPDRVFAARKKMRISLYGKKIAKVLNVDLGMQMEAIP